MNLLTYKNSRKLRAALALVFIASAGYAALMTGVNFRLLTGILNSGGGSVSSQGYATTAAIGGGYGGEAASASYRSGAGFASQSSALSGILPAVSIRDAHVYPSPFKPGAGGIFDAEHITFKDLTPVATIRVFNIRGELVRTIRKDDTSVDYYRWDATNDAGNSLASGVYIFYITNPEGETAKGKFSIIR